MRIDASSAAIFIDNGVLMDLSSYIEGDPSFDLDDYFPNAVDITRRGDAIYGLPMGFTPMVLYYNKRLFDEAGVAYPDGSWTFSDFLSAAQRLTSEDVYGFEFSNWMAGWILFLWNNGGDVLSPDGTTAVGFFDSPECVAAVQFIHDLVNVHRVSPTMSQTAALGVDMFANGRAAMKFVGHWAIIGYQSSKEISISDIGVAPIPSNLDTPVTVMYESGLAIFRDAKHPDAGWELIKHLLSYGVQTRYNATGIEVCALRAVAEEAADPVASRAKNRVVPAALEQAFVAIVPSARAPWGAKVERYNLVEPIGEKMMDRVLRQGVPVEVALRDAAREIDEELNKE
ncbi:MAG: sugar ABC transporter substrate-binding protein, partial [Armatimonadetes bacterium]|nr:sugar ABC transporter substrate-binding protein [Armatimonadota bacterium]